MKHNNAIPNVHFHKDWKRYVKTWFNQPAKKVKRRTKRLERAKKLAPRPVDLLHPIVRGQTNKYNTKVRAGRGFTLEELKGAGVRRCEALSIGIPIDHRRKNRCEEGYQQNVTRLRKYRAKLVIFPRNPKKEKKGDSKKEDRAKAVQVFSDHVLRIRQTISKEKPRKITEEERKVSVYAVLHKARKDAQLKGVREKRAKDKKEGKSAKDKKKQKEEEAAMED